MRKDYGVRKKMKDGGKLKMVTNKQGQKVPFYAADGKGKMAMGGRVKKMGGGMMMQRPMMEKGGSLKAVKPNQKGLKKLPTEVRNKMGYMKKGGKVNGK